MNFSRYKDLASSIRCSNKRARNSEWEIGVDITQDNKRLWDPKEELKLYNRQEIGANTRQKPRTDIEYETKVAIKQETRARD